MAILAAVLFCLPLSAQTTASLTGTVSASGQPLAGVRVTISSPALQGTRNAVTGETGSYDFSAMPPGEYQITFTRDGLHTVTSSATLRLSQLSRVDVTLRKPLVEDIVV